MKKSDAQTTTEKDARSGPLGRLGSAGYFKVLPNRQPQESAPREKPRT